MAEAVCDFEKVISRHLPNLLAVRIVGFYLTKRKDVADAKEIASYIGASAGEVYSMMKELVARGVLKAMGGELFNYSPDMKVRGQIQAFMKKWDRRTSRRRLLPLLQAKKNASGGFWEKCRAWFRRG